MLRDDAFEAWLSSTAATLRLSPEKVARLRARFYADKRIQEGEARSAALALAERYAVDDGSGVEPV